MASPALAWAFVAAALFAGAAGGARAVEDDMAMGSPGARVTLVEYASPTCPHCARFNAQDFPALKARYIDTGKVRYVLRELPLHPSFDVPAFLLARCAGPGRYFAVIDHVMRAQPEFIDAGPDTGRRYRAVLMREAQAAGLSQAKAWACMTDERAAKAMQARVDREKNADNVHATPAFLVNGVRVERRAGREWTLADVTAPLDAALARAGRGPPATRS